MTLLNLDESSLLNNNNKKKNNSNMPSACLWNQCSDNDDEIVEKKWSGV